MKIKTVKLFCEIFKKIVIERFFQAKEICIWLQKEKERKKKKTIFKRSSSKSFYNDFLFERENKRKKVFFNDMIQTKRK